MNQEDPNARIRELEAALNNARYKLNKNQQALAKSNQELKLIQKSRTYRALKLISAAVLRGRILARMAMHPGQVLQRYRDKQEDAQTEERQRHLHEELAERAQQIPQSNGASFPMTFAVNAAIITDEYMYNFYRDSFRELFWLTPQNWEQIFNDNQIDLLIYVSCWRGGLKNEWRGHLRNVQHLESIDRILERSRQEGIQMVFQTIEDPSNFDHFLPLARRFPIILTSDRDKVPDYERECPDAKVIYGEYGCNPRFNNPVGVNRDRYLDCFFAGSYPARYKARRSDMDLMFDSILSSGSRLTIADRNAAFDLEDYRFPQRFRRHVVDAYPHDLLQAVHKLFRININFNSIKQSPTMCAMRVYELQAQASEILSNYALSVSNRFPNIGLVVYPRQISHYLERHETDLAYEQRLRAMRTLLSRGTAYHRVREILKLAGINADPQRPRLLVASNHGSEQTGLAGAGDQVDLSFCQLDEWRNVDLSEYDYLALFSPDLPYESHYLVDMINAFKFVDVPFVTRCAYYAIDGPIKGIEHDYTWEVPDQHRTLINLRRQPNPAVVFQTPPDEAGYSVDRFGIGYTDHLTAKKTLFRSNPVLSVIIPVFNNGFYLEERCLPSLERNRRFADFKLIVVDDGSTDPYTLEVLERIQLRYPNLEVHRQSSPSGSASRPRNTGIEAARTDFLTFLDPDNAISPGGYDALLAETLTDDQLDCVCGFQLKITSHRVSVIGRLFKEPAVQIEDPRKLLESEDFPVVSTQAAVIRTDLLKKTGLRFIEGTIGQDTTFGYELLLISQRVKFVHDCYLEYFAERGDSVTNRVGTEFFQRSLRLEEEQKIRLQKHGVWQLYASNRSESFVRGWYIPKLKLVEENELEACKGILRSIATINDIDSEELLETSGERREQT